MANEINIVVSAQVGDATRGLQQVQKQVQQVDRQIKRSTVGLKNNANQFNSTAVATNKYAKGALQQAGYQIGDFAVQLSGGQNALQAFGQQGSQLAGAFGPMGAVVGAGIAIFAAIGVAIGKAAGAAKGAIPEFKDLSDATSALGSAFDSIEATDVDTFFNSSMSPAVRRLKDEYSGLLDMMNLVAQEERNRAIAGVMDKIGPDPDYIRRLQQTLDTMRRAQSGPDDGFMAAERAQEMAKVTSELAKQKVITDAINSLNGATRQDALERLRIVEADLTRKGLITAELRAQLRDYAQQSGLLSELKSKTKDLGEAAEIAAKSFGESLKNAISDIKIEMDGAASSASLMAQRMLASARAFMAAQIAARKARVQAAVDIANQRAGGGRGGAQGAGRDQVERILMAMGGEDVGGNDTASTVNRATTVAKEAAKAVDMYVSPSFLRLQSIQEEVSSGIEDGFMSMIDGTKSVKDAFRSMASEIIKELYRIFVVKRITGMISGFIGGMSGVGMTNAPAANPLSGLSGSQMLPARAMGGQVTGGRAYMVGERGPEMIVPQRNGNVVPNNQLGGGGVTVVQNINVSTGVQQTVRAEIKTLMPQIAEASKAAVADAVRRGGSYGRAFA
jgi:hypothetical protein